MKIGKFKVGQLRKELEARGLDTSGTRPALMKRLKEALETEDSAPAKAAEPAQSPPSPPEETPALPPREKGEHQPVKAAVQEARAPDAINETDERPSEEVAVEAAEGEEISEAVGESPKVIATGSLVRASKESMDERLRKRRERFGAVEQPQPKVKKESHDATEDERKFEEAKKRRAEKFGAVEAEGISKEEKERRLKRQRRFQSMGNATVV